MVCRLKHINYYADASPVKALCDRFDDASEMVKSSGTYFQGLSVNAGQNHIAAWTVEVERAEAIRLEKPSSMDIYGIRLENAPANPMPSTESNEPLSPVDAWIFQALLVEEAQLV